MTRGLEYAAVRIVAAIVSVLPMPVVRRIGGWLGWLAYLLDRAHRRTALGNLGAAFPTRSERDRRAMARAMFAHFGSLLLELLKFATYTQAQMRAAVVALRAIVFDGASDGAATGQRRGTIELVQRLRRRP